MRAHVYVCVCECVCVCVHRCVRMRGMQGAALLGGCLFHSPAHPSAPTARLSLPLHHHHQRPSVTHPESITAMTTSSPAPSGPTTPPSCGVVPQHHTGGGPGRGRGRAGGAEQRGRGCCKVSVSNCGTPTRHVKGCWCVCVPDHPLPIAAMSPAGSAQTAPPRCTPRHNAPLQTHTHTHTWSHTGAAPLCS